MTGILTSRSSDIAATLETSQRTEQAAAESHADLKSLMRVQEESESRLGQCITQSKDAILAQRSPPLHLDQTRHSDYPTDNVFLQTFKFRHMDDRETPIPRAHVKTYEWILDPQQGDSGMDSERAQAKEELKDILSDMNVDSTCLNELLTFKDV